MTIRFISGLCKKIY